MAKSTAVWGIEIGQSALKALRCTIEGGEVVATAFDFVEYPKILSQPEAEPEVLIREALGKFLERNETRGDRIAVSVPGQSGLAKFFKPPPVEVKKIADIVKYEARQQIPFDLEDVVWDYQMMPGSTVEEGFALESEIGLFAMKREQAYRQLEPLKQSGLEVDVIQLAPLALYNMVVYDRLHERVESNTFDVDSPPPSTVVLALGTDSTDLIVTNGFRIWQRSMPIGGNHFTRQLTKDLKLTFAKAEHLKRNAREAEDPKLIFQTMRPVFNDLVTEIQRSIGFFQTINKKAKIDQLLLAGNTVKLPGLTAYLGKNLGYDVQTLDGFSRLQGSEVVGSPAFKDNVYSYGVCYGLCLQALGRGPLTTSLVPSEIMTERLIRSKKPWAVAACASLLVGMVGYYAMIERSWWKVQPNFAKANRSWQQATTAVDTAKSYSDGKTKADKTLLAQLAFLKSIGDEVSGNVDRRLLWLELMHTVHSAIPRTSLKDGAMPSIKDVPLLGRDDIYITGVETMKVEDATTWFTERRKGIYQKEMRDWSRKTNNPLPEDFDADPGPTGEGWVVTLKGYHFHNDPQTQVGDEGGAYVRRTLMDNLLRKTVKLPIGDGQVEEFTMKQMGISYPFLQSDRTPDEATVPNPDYEPVDGGTGMLGGGYPGGGGPPGGLGGGFGGGIGGDSGGYPGAGGYPGGGGGYPGGTGGTGTGGAGSGGEGSGDGKEPADDSAKPTLKVRKFTFDFQFFWQPQPIVERLKKKQEEEAKAREEAAQQGAEGDSPQIEEDNVAMNPN